MSIDPFAALGLPCTATKTEVVARFHELALELHPDTGGLDLDAFIQVKMAYEEARKMAPEFRPCGACKGTGFIKISHGFYSLKQQCTICNGLGH